MSIKLLTLSLALTGLLSIAYADCGKCHGEKTNSSSCGEKCMPGKMKGAMMNKAKEKMMESSYGTINTQALYAMVQAGTPVTVLDARSGKYDDGKRIPGARQLASNASMKEADALIPAKDSLVVAYCTNLQCPASTKLIKNLQEYGYTNLLKYPEGIEAWEAAGYPIEKAEMEGISSVE